MSSAPCLLPAASCGASARPRSSNMVATCSSGDCSEDFTTPAADCTLANALPSATVHGLHPPDCDVCSATNGHCEACCWGPVQTPASGACSKARLSSGHPWAAVADIAHTAHARWQSRQPHQLDWIELTHFLNQPALNKRTSLDGNPPAARRRAACRTPAGAAPTPRA